MNNPSVLFVEDEAALARITANTLRGENFSVTIAENGTKALELFLSQEFDICIVDVMIPQIDGYTLVREIRKRDPDIPVIFVTARILKDDVIEGYNSGGNDYLRKPFSIEELIMRMNELLRRTEVARKEKLPQQIGVGTYIFNPLRMELIHPDETIQLTHRENEIVKRLTGSPHEIVTIDSMLLELWGDNSYYNSRSLNVFVTKIRKYFRHDPAIRVVNIRSIGYKLVIS
jgi:DNA-binding response OmpR family regulator